MPISNLYHLNIVTKAWLGLENLHLNDLARKDFLLDHQKIQTLNQCREVNLCRLATKIAALERSKQRHHFTYEFMRISYSGNFLIGGV